MKKQIEVTKEVREKLEKVFNCTRISVWRALSFESDSDQSKRIRKAAKEMGGVTLCIGSECETIHDANGYMRQWFGNGAVLEADKHSGHVDVYDRQGIKRNMWENPTITQLYVIQEFAAAL